MRVRKKIPYMAPETEWEEIRLEKDFLGTNDVSGGAGTSGFGQTDLGGYEDSDWGGED